MASSLFVTLSVFVLLFLSLLHRSVSLPTTIGVTYSTFSPPPTTTALTRGTPPPSPPPPPSPDRIAKTLTSLNFPSVRLPDSDPEIIRVFSYTNTSLLLSIPNALVPPLASNRSVALRWLYRHVLPFYPRSRISLISIGNDIFDTRPDFSPFLLPAIRNVYLALRDLGIKKIPVSTTFSFFDVITTAFPPSSALFREPAGSLVIKPLLQFLDDTNSSFLINLYPYNMYRLNSEIPIGFALFQDYPFNFRDDLITGVRYKNLFDMMVDAVITAMAVSGHENVPVVVAETGWPSSGGDSTEVDATPAFAEMYLKGLMGHLRSGSGTPLRKEGVAEAYIYELVDKEVKGMRSWGILYKNLTRKYNSIVYSGGGGSSEIRGLLKILVVGFLMVLCI
ncbi:hypothetical protein QYF36_014520 [Acer negundo]|nr:hypothetical protein QYF36_014520 [Acer negundo]